MALVNESLVGKGWPCTNTPRRSIVEVRSRCGPLANYVELALKRHRIGNRRAASDETCRIMGSQDRAVSPSIELLVGTFAPAEEESGPRIAPSLLSETFLQPAALDPVARKEYEPGTVLRRDPAARCGPSRKLPLKKPCGKSGSRRPPRRPCWPHSRMRRRWSQVLQNLGAPSCFNSQSGLNLAAA